MSENRNLQFTHNGEQFSIDLSHSIGQIDAALSGTGLAAFKEETGKRKIVIYDTNLWKVEHYGVAYLHYKLDKNTPNLLMPYNASSCYRMFNTYRGELLDLHDFDMFKIIDARNMFMNCRAKEINLSGIRVGSGMNILGMFNDCRYVKHLDLSSFTWVSTYNLSYLFSGCWDLEDVQLPKSFESAKEIQSIFYCCEALYKKYKTRDDQLLLDKLLTSTQRPKNKVLRALNLFG